MRKGISSQAILAPLIILLLCGACLFLYGKYASSLRLAKDLHLRLQKQMSVRLPDPFPVTAAFTKEISVPVKMDIPIHFPVTSLLRVPIDEMFEIPLDDAFLVEVNQPVRLNETIQVKCDVPLDTTIEASILGMKKKIPVKGVIPINIAVPLRQDVTIAGRLAVRMVDPLKVKVKKDVEAPINFVVEGMVPLDQKIKVPVAEKMDCVVHMDKDLPFAMDLDLSAGELGRAVRISRTSQAKSI